MTTFKVNNSKWTHGVLTDRLHGVLTDRLHGVLTDRLHGVLTDRLHGVLTDPLQSKYWHPGFVEALCLSKARNANKRSKLIRYSPNKRLLAFTLENYEDIWLLNSTLC